MKKSRQTAGHHAKGTLLFLRDYRRFSGGHLKIWDYFNHTFCSKNHAPEILFSQESDLGPLNPWFATNSARLHMGSPAGADALFLGGLDWHTVSHRGRAWEGKPIINLIQGLRHASPGDGRFGFLEKRAIRICVSEAIAMALRDTRRVNGPVFTIPNGIDLALLPKPPCRRDIPLLLCALKRAELGKALDEELRALGYQPRLLSTPLPRAEYLKLVARAELTVFLPLPAEGFFLPALEGMALGTLVICPDAVGNRGYCSSAENCFLVTHSISSLVEAVKVASSLGEAARARLIENARTTVLAGHRIEIERRAYLDILDNLEQIW